MTIQPLPTNRPPEISVTEPIEPAYERVKLMLFKPFDLTKWIVIGFCAWLAGLGEYHGGGGSGFHSGNYSSQNNNQTLEDFRHFYHKASDYVLANLDWIVPVVVFSVFFILAIWVVLLWLNSRGKFMLLHCVAGNVAEVDIPWRQYEREANSLFRFQIVLGLAGMALCLPIMVFMAIDIIRMILQNETDLPGVMLAAGLLFAWILLSIVFLLIRKFMVDFVVPIQFLRRTTCVAAWREFWGLLTANPGKFTVYILFQIVLGMAIGAMVMALFVATCCTACFVAVLPFLGTVLLLPIFVFKRAYALYYLAQYGVQYDVFPKPPTPPAPPGITPTGPTLGPISAG